MVYPCVGIYSVFLRNRTTSNVISPLVRVNCSFVYMIYHSPSRFTVLLPISSQSSVPHWCPTKSSPPVVRPLILFFDLTRLFSSSPSQTSFSQVRLPSRSCYHSFSCRYLILPWSGLVFGTTSQLTISVTLPFGNLPQFVLSL